MRYQRARWCSITPSPAPARRDPAARPRRCRTAPGSRCARITKRSRRAALCLGAEAQLAAVGAAQMREVGGELDRRRLAREPIDPHRALGAARRVVDAADEVPGQRRAVAAAAAAHARRPPPLGLARVVAGRVVDHAPAPRTVRLSRRPPAACRARERRPACASTRTSARWGRAPECRLLRSAAGRARRRGRARAGVPRLRASPARARPGAAAGACGRAAGHRRAGGAPRSSGAAARSARAPRRPRAPR